MDFEGYGVSPGIAIGNIVIKKPFEYEITNELVDSVKVAKKEFKDVIEICKKDTEKLYKKMIKNSGKDEAEIFQAHLMILKDPEFIDKIIDEIETSNKNIAFCLNKVSNEYIKMFENMDNEYLKQRALDIKDIKERLLKKIFNYQEIVNLEKENQIIVSKELTPSDTAKLDLNKVKGFITETGGKTSHTAIMAKSLELPAIVGVKNIINNIRNDQKIIIDASTGKILVNPTKEEINEYKLKKEKLKKLELN
ncbi:MAG: phosphoenolpyruvate-utilizing N-terminal domain-containing protein [Bacillota bacterium]